MTSKDIRVGLIGLGAMGAPMAGHLLDGLGAITVSNRSRGKAAELEQRGARWVDTAREVAAGTDLLVLMVPAMPEIRGLLEGPDGIIAGAQGPLTVVVCSTVAASDVRQLDQEVAEASGGRVRIVDAPVSGGEVGAKAGTLSIMVGGDEELVAPVLEALAHTGRPVHLGPLGAGEVAKACNQAIVAANIAAIAEASVVAERSGLDVAKTFELLQGGYAGSAVLKDKTTRFATKDYSPSGPLEYWIKDLKAYLAECQATGTTSIVVPDVLRVVAELVDAGRGRADTAVMQEWVDKDGKL